MTATPLQAEVQCLLSAPEDDFLPPSFRGRIAKRDGDSTSAEYAMDSFLSHGTYGQVWKVRRITRSDTNRGTPEFYVAKYILTSEMDQHKKMVAMKEILCMKRLQHYACVKLIEAFVDEETRATVLIMEWMDAGDLSTQIVNLKRNHELSFSEGILINSFVQLILALHYMHSSRMLHRDLKPSNVVLTSGGLVKLADFGFSQWYETTVSGQVGNTFLGTEPYLAPEQWSRGGYSSKADVWSLGVVLYELVQLSRPFEGATTEDYQRMICSDPHPQISCSQCPPELADIINWMLRKDPKERPAVSDIMKVPWVQQRIQGWLEWVADESYVSDLVKADINLTTQRQLQVEQTPVDLRPSQDSLDYEGNVSLWLEGSNCAVRYLVLQGGRLEMVDSNVSTRGANCFILDSQYEVQLVQAHAFVLSFPDRCRAWCMVCADAQQWVEKIKRNTMAHPML